MRERPILFSAPMARAILDGRKTMTRRAVKLRNGADVVVTNGQVWKPALVDYAGYVDCPYGQPGDRLWVRETFAQHPQFADVAYRADGEEFEDSDGFLWEPKWTPSIHMPRRLSRIMLEIVSVRIERLHSISEVDAVAEGVERTVTGDGWRRYCDPDMEEVGVPPVATARQSFFTLWNKINGHGSWVENPFVWVIEFRRVP